MKNILYIAALAVVLLQLTSCREDIVIKAEYKETPVIYGILDQADSLHYIKINRGFVGPGNALEFAKIPDSNYFASVDARVLELNNGAILRTFQLRDTILTNKKQDGAFFAPEQKVYYFAADDLNPNYTYRLVADINEGKLTVTGETKLVNDMAVSNDMDKNGPNLKFVDNTLGSYVSAPMTCSAGTAVVGDITFEITIKEIKASSSAFKTFKMKLFEGEIANNRFAASVSGESFFQTIRANLTNDPDITSRQLESITAVFTGGAVELYNYLTVNQPTSSLAQNKPTYTNLTVTEGFQVVGIFTSRQTVRVKKDLFQGNGNPLSCINKQSRRELCQGSILIDFLFCSQHTSDINDSYYCY